MPLKKLNKKTLNSFWLRIKKKKRQNSSNLLKFLMPTSKKQLLPPTLQPLISSMWLKLKNLSPHLFLLPNLKNQSLTSLTLIMPLHLPKKKNNQPIMELPYLIWQANLHQPSPSRLPLNLNNKSLRAFIRLQWFRTTRLKVPLSTSWMLLWQLIKILWSLTFPSLVRLTTLVKENTVDLELKLLSRRKLTRPFYNYSSVTLLKWFSMYF